MNAIGKILPIDGYHVVMDEQPPIDFNASLTHFYQPLIGIQQFRYTIHYFMRQIMRKKRRHIIH